MNKIDNRILSELQNAYSANVVTFAAAANSGARKPIAFPARKFPAICIHANDGHAEPAGFTPLPEERVHNFSMLGVSVRSTYSISRTSPASCKSSLKVHNHARGGYKYLSGTSMATPLAAALAANILAYVQDRVRIHDTHPYDIIEEIFMAMSTPDGGYRVLTPWRRFIDWNEGKTTHKFFRSEIERVLKDYLIRQDAA